MFYTASLSLAHHMAIPVTDHSLSLDQIYTNIPSPKGNPIFIHSYIVHVKY